MDYETMHKTIEVIQVSGNSDDLNRCIEQFNEWRSGAGLMSCGAFDQKMIDQIVERCEDFIKEHEPHFYGCEMSVMVTDPINNRLED